MSVALEYKRIIRTAASCSTSAHQLFEAQAARTPDAVAILFGDERLTYQHLNAQANQLAHYLRSLGVGPDTLVAVSVERSIEMIVGLFGILKAGGAYVPLDPAYPKERLAAMLEDARAPVLLTERRLLESLPQTEARVICLDSDWKIIAHSSTENPISKITPENLAYVIYTSGSTGKPKGVLIEHRSLANYVEAASAEFAIEAGDRVLQFASISFDTSAEEIYPCLARGASLVLRTDSMLNSSSAFLEQCRDWNITILDLPTAYWHELTASLDGEGLSLPPSIRLVIIGGERALPERVAMWRTRVDERVRLLNTYGPTEATIVATVADLSRTPTSEPVADVTVGRPIPNVQAYILDQHLQPVPMEIIGELHIGGAGLARGYLNHPELTAERFISNPFSDEAGARFYKTGDLARYLPDGNIQLAGRIDDQVKINGFRIELGEIETALRSDASVRDAVVVAREDRPGEKRLVAYVVPKQSRDLDAQAGMNDELRKFLKKKLPGYMLPAAFRLLDALPLSPNGKVDRKRLPLPDRMQINVGENYARPRDPLEKHLVEIWEEILNVHPIGIRDNFFDLGGHSLLSVRLMDRIEQELGKKIPLATLFEEATVERLAAEMLKQEAITPQSTIVEIQKGGSMRPFFFLHGDYNGGGFYCLNLARGLRADQPFYAIQPHGLDGEPIPATIEAMAISHLQALRAFQPTGPYLLGGYCNGGLVAFEMGRQLELQGERVDLLVLLCASASNVRYKLLQSIVNRVNREVEARLSRFLALRERVVRIEGIWNYYRGRLGELSRMEADEQITFLGNKAGKVVTNLAGALRSVLIAGKSPEAPSNIDQMAQAAEDRHHRATAIYDRAALGYVPKHYAGRVIVLWPGELALDNPDDPSDGWSKVAAEVAVHTIPGGHITCVTRHVHDLAGVLQACLEKTQAADTRR